MLGTVWPCLSDNFKGTLENTVTITPILKSLLLQFLHRTLVDQRSRSHCQLKIKQLHWIKAQLYDEHRQSYLSSGLFLWLRFYKTILQFLTSACTRSRIQILGYNEVHQKGSEVCLYSSPTSTGLSKRKISEGVPPVLPPWSKHSCTKLWIILTRMAQGMEQKCSWSSNCDYLNKHD